jgi:hypothetical protein
MQKLEGFATKLESKVGLAEHEMPIAAQLFRDVMALIDGLHQTTGIPATPPAGQQ